MEDPKAGMPAILAIPNLDVPENLEKKRTNETPEVMFKHD